MNSAVEIGTLKVDIRRQVIQFNYVQHSEVIFTHKIPTENLNCHALQMIHMKCQALFTHKTKIIFSLAFTAIVREYGHMNCLQKTYKKHQSLFSLNKKKYILVCHLHFLNDASRVKISYLQQDHLLY